MSAPTMMASRPCAVSDESEAWRCEVPKLEAARRPPEWRGLRRDETGLLITADGGRRVEHGRFLELADVLESGDVVVVNVSAMRNAAFSARRGGGRVADVHLSTKLPGEVWIVELRRPGEDGSKPLKDARCGETLRAGDVARVTLLAPYRPELRGEGGPVRLWLADVDMKPGFMERRGRPVRYGYTDADVPADIELYQNVYAEVAGSAEPPSAGRGFSRKLLARLQRRGVEVASVVLHCGVSSLEADEPPHEEYFEVESDTVETLASARRRGGRVVAVGTTVLRALESALDDRGRLRPVRGWTDLVFGPDDQIRTADGLLSGFHPPDASHLDVLSAFDSPRHVVRAYRAARERGSLAHELGDAHLMWRGEVARHRFDCRNIASPSPSAG